MRRGLDLGHRGVVISAFPNGTLQPTAEDEPFWALAQETDTPVAVHIGSFLPTTAGAARARPWTSRSSWAPRARRRRDRTRCPVVCQLLFSGVFDRFTDLKLLLVESNIGWIPTLLEQVDDMFYRYRFFTNGEQMRSTPSRIFHRNFWASFMVDTVGMDLRHRLNIDHMMWSTDYPHTGTDWPNSRITIERNFRGIPKAEVKKMLHDNCRALYHLDHVPDTVD